MQFLYAISGASIGFICLSNTGDHQCAQVINKELFAILVVMAIVTTFMTTPFVMWLHPPARDASPYTRRKLGDAKDESGELRLLACAHGTRNLPAMVHLTEILRGKSRKSLRVFVLHLMEFSERSSAIRIASMARREGRPHWREVHGMPLFHFRSFHLYLEHLLWS